MTSQPTTASLGNELSSPTAPSRTGATIGRGFLVADFNGDKKLDLFACNQGPEWKSLPAFPGEQNLLFLSGDDGKLHDVSATHLPQLKAFSHGCSAADVDGDGHIDIWVHNLFFSGPPASPPVRSYLMLNDGRGHFTIVADTGAGADLPRVGTNGRLPLEVTRMGLAATTDFFDVNADGHPDLILWGAVVDFPSIRTVVLLNDGRGYFSLAAPDVFPPLPFAGKGYVSKAVVADLNSDGLMDFLVGVHAPDHQSHSFRTLITRGNGTFVDETAVRIPVQDVPVSEDVPIFFFADLDGDGHKDLLYKSFAREGCCLQPSWFTEFYRNNGRGFFTRVPADSYANINPVFWPVDVNRDGAADFTFVCWTKVSGVCVVTSSNVPPAASVVPNATSFRAGQTLTLRLFARNPEGHEALDLYVGAVLPDGSTVAPLVGPNTLGGVGELSAPASVAPFAAAGGGYAVIGLPVVNFTFPASGIQVGTYRLFAALLRQGSVTDNAINDGDLIALDFVDVAYSP